MEVHLDLLGGLAGDMFVASVLDAFPEHQPQVVRQVAALVPLFAADAAPCRLVACDDGTFAGSRFVVPPVPGAAPALQPHRHPAAAASSDLHSHGGRAHEHDPGFRVHQSHADDRGHDHSGSSDPVPDHDHAALTSDDHSVSSSHDHDHDHDHTSSHPGESHVAWASIRGRLQHALGAGILRHAVGIFGVLAEAEAAVHGVTVDAVEFHEVGAWDSVVDIVAAAVLIDLLDARRWTVSAVPLGSGRIRTAHGVMPVPPPATALLLRGFLLIDDGVPGERVTPTGAAILKYLLPEGSAPQPSHGTGRADGAALRPRALRRTGVGFGTRRLDGISNCVRLLAFDDAAAPADATLAGTGGTSAHRELAVVEFEVDDQSAEELAMGLDRLRSHASIFDVVQAPVFGKKGRMMTSVRLLASPSALADVIGACFRETTTIGLRHSTVRGAALPRSFEEVRVDGQPVRVKLVERPGGTTAKAESDDALELPTQQARRQVRHEAERLALAKREGRDGG